MANATKPEPSWREDPWHVETCFMPRLRLALRSVCAGAAGAFAVSGDICGIGRIQRLLDDLSPGFVARIRRQDSSPAVASRCANNKPGIARHGGIYYNVSVGMRAMCWTPIAASPRPRTSVARQSQPRGQMSAIKTLSVAAITAMSFAVSAHAGHVNVTARVNPAKANVPKGNTSTYKKPGTVPGVGPINRAFRKPSFPSGPTQIPIGRLPTSFAAAAHAGQVRQPNMKVAVPKTGMPNPLPPTGVRRGGSSGHARLLGLAVAPVGQSRPHLKPFVRHPSAPVVR